MASKYLALALLLVGWLAQPATAVDSTELDLENRFVGQVEPFLRTYCIACHGPENPKADFDLSHYSTMAAAVDGHKYWELVLEKLEQKQMPPQDADKFPSAEVRQQIIDWIQSSRRHEAAKHAGDPGIVLARRLSNAEFDYTIRDLTGVDMRPTKEFPIDPTNQAGFDNSGESLVMSATLLDKYLKATRFVADHMFLKTDGFGFAPTPMLVETDRDQYCVKQIIQFYHAQNIDYADYFQTAWRFKNRTALGRSSASLNDFADESNVSPKYLATIWTILEEETAEVGPLVKLQSMWRELPLPSQHEPEIARIGCETMSQFVIQFRQKVEPRFLNITTGEDRSASSQPFLIWKNVQYATHRMKFDTAQLQVEGETQAEQAEVDEPGSKGEFGPGRTVLIKNEVGDPDLVVPAGQRGRYEVAIAKFCGAFPDMFYKQERGRNYFDTSKDQGRYLSAGFHNIMGYFRDDQPLYELILDSEQQKQLDSMWQELDFVAAATERMYVQFSRSGGPREGRLKSDDETNGTELSGADAEATSPIKIERLKNLYLTRADGGSEVAKGAIRDYFEWINERIRWVEKARLDAEPSHLQALMRFAARAYRRPLTPAEENELLAFYHSARQQDGMDHEAAMRESIVGVLMYPDVCLRLNHRGGNDAMEPLSDYELASRLSYFLWSSTPDEELLSHAAVGDLHNPTVLSTQSHRMLKDSRARALAIEFGGNWLDFRQFESLSTVDLRTFPSFTPDLQQAMFEEPVRLLLDVFQNDRSVLDLLYAKHTFVNPVLAKHYGIPIANLPQSSWVRIDNADQFNRGGLLSMAVFLTKNAPGLRTSPVKRGNWVVKNVLGERIAAPPPGVPELPQDEAKLDLPLRELLARHREDANCAVCHERFDSLGIAFEGFGPIGERREIDLGGHRIDAAATFPGGSKGSGVEGVKQYVVERRQNDFVDNFCRKLLAYALGRSLLLSDEILIEEMQQKLSANGYRFENMIESIITSQQFLAMSGK